MNVIELQNAIELLKQALYFYADEKNYEQKHNVNQQLFSMIEMDSGSQARFALEKIESFEKMSKTMEEEFVKELSESIEKNEDVNKVLGIIEDYKKILEEDDDNKI